LIICGSAVLDGHTFCVGVVALSLREKTAALQLTRLMSQTPFKGRHRVLQGGNHSLSLFSLGELIDMYGRQQATKCHDRIFALLGMSSDADLSLLHIGYDRPIGDLISAVVKHVFGEKVTVKAIQEQSHVAILQCVGCILGQIRPWSSSPWGSSDPESGGAKIKVAARGNFNGGAGMQSIHNITIKEPWHLSTAANPVKWGDLLYLCDGASRPCIIRPWSKHCFNVIATVVQCPEYKESVWSDRRLHARNLLLTWDWMHSEDNLDILEASRHPSALIQLDPVQRAINFWTFAQILGDLGDVREAQELLAETVPKAQAQIPEEEKLGLASSNRTVPLLWACNCGYEKVVSRLLAENAETEVKDWLYRTPLWLAISGNHGHIANMLLERGADVHACNCGGWQPFSVAVVKGSVEAMQVLVAAGADVNETCYTEFSPLSWISDLKHKEVIAKLRPRKRLKEEEFGGWTPLHLAAALGHATMVVELIDMGANIDAITNDGHSSLLLAIQFEHGDTVAALTGEGASAIKRHDRGLSPLQAAVQSGSVESVSGLLSAGADFQYEDARGSWLLQTVVDFRLGRAEMVWVMLNAGIPLDFPMHDFPGSPMDFIGTKVLMSTIKQRDFVLFELLLRASSDDAIQATCAELRKAADVDDFADAVELLEVRLATCDVQKVDPMLGWQHSYVG
jgi:ankyrin repeat protein